MLLLTLVRPIEGVGIAPLLIDCSSQALNLVHRRVPALPAHSTGLQVPFRLFVTAAVTRMEMLFRSRHRRRVNLATGGRRVLKRHCEDVVTPRPSSLQPISEAADHTAVACVRTPVT